MLALRRPDPPGPVLCGADPPELRPVCGRQPVVALGHLIAVDTTWTSAQVGPWEEIVDEALASGHWHGRVAVGQNQRKAAVVEIATNIKHRSDPLACGMDVEGGTVWARRPRPSP